MQKKKKLFVLLSLLLIVSCGGTSPTTASLGAPLPAATVLVEVLEEGVPNRTPVVGALVTGRKDTAPVVVDRSGYADQVPLDWSGRTTIRVEAIGFHVREVIKDGLGDARETVRVALDRVK